MTDEGDKRRDLMLRTKAFAVRVFRFAEALPPTLAGRTIAKQIARSGSSTAANYRAAQRAQTRAEFVAKLHDAREEADETAFWIELAIESGCVTETKARLLFAEADELTAILSAATKTAKGR